MKYNYRSIVKIFLFLSLIVLSTGLYAQVEGRKTDMGDTPKAKLSPYGKIDVNWYKLGWFVDLNGGTRLLGFTSDAVDLGPGFNGNMGIGIFLTDKFGLKARLDYSRFKFTPGFNTNPESQGRMWSTSIEATSDLLPFTHGSKIRDWRIELHGGFGLSTYRNTDFADYIEDTRGWEDPAIKGNDDMIHMILGITPQYHLSGRFSINLDFSTFFFFKQDYGFDTYNGERMNGVGTMLTSSLGITFRP
ncbi:MAG: hypothetical protein R3277_08790 [Brumimicrobium sp.]|nr:hypothetical protein [Brumimicrobium sp.]